MFQHLREARYCLQHNNSCRTRNVTTPLVAAPQSSTTRGITFSVSHNTSCDARQLCGSSQTTTACGTSSLFRFVCCSRKSPGNVAFSQRMLKVADSNCGELTRRRKCAMSGYCWDGRLTKSKPLNQCRGLVRVA